MAEFSSLASILNWEEDILIIDWKDADKYYGQYVIVEGTIVDTYNSGKACFLNFDPDWQQYFTAVIFACDFPSFPESPENYYLDKKVQIIGIIKEYEGSPEIIVKTPDQIKIIKRRYRLLVGGSRLYVFAEHCKRIFLII